jgi:hypothetical protein
VSFVRFRAPLQCVSNKYGNPDEITIKDFADEIIKLTGTNQKWFIFLYQSMILCNDNQKQENCGGKLK